MSARRTSGRKRGQDALTAATRQGAATPSGPIITVEAYIPESGTWIAVDADRGKLTFYVTTEAAGKLASLAEQMVGRILIVAIGVMPFPEGTA